MINVEEEVKKAFEKGGYVYDSTKISIKYNSRLKTTLGRCHYRINVTTKRVEPYKLDFSTLFLNTGSDLDIIEVIRHEVAHALVCIETGENHGHDEYFKKMCQRLETSKDQISSQINYKVPIQQVFKYTGICTNCGAVVGQWHRAGKIVKYPHLYNCGKCKTATIKITQNF